MEGFQQELLRRLPLAEAVLSLFSHVLDERFLDGLFDRHRGRCYQDTLKFPTLVYLVRDALLVHDGSGRQSFERAREAGELPVSIANAYGKLSRLPPGLSAALLAEGAQRLAAVLPGGAGASPLPASLRGMGVVVVDGKKIKKVAKRLLAARGLPGKMLGGKLLAALSLETGLVVAMNCSPDGEKNDVPLVPGLLPQVRAEVARPILWVADRQFCDLNLPALFTAREGDRFLVRWTRKLTFHPDPQRPAAQGVDAGGRRFVQEWGWVGGARDGRRRYVRRVTLFREGEQDVSLITDLLDGEAYPAGDLLEVYLMRWGIERVFQQVTEVFELRRLIGSTPQATVFQASFCLLLYNMVQVVKAHVAAAAGREPEKVSTEKLFYDATHELVAWAKVGEPAHAAAALAPPPEPAQMRRRLAELLGPRVWTDRWLKAPPKKKKPPGPKPKVKSGHGGHTSVWRVLQEYRQKQEQET